jgi:hypothetical protein
MSLMDRRWMIMITLDEAVDREKSRKRQQHTAPSGSNELGEQIIEDR